MQASGNYSLTLWEMAVERTIAIKCAFCHSFVLHCVPAGFVF